jgi:glycosyltransferase involved in cell wall biosynthesis
MKHILFYTDTPLLGGAENQMYLLAKNLPKEKYVVTLACSSGKKLNSWCKKFLDLGANVLRLKVLHKHDPRHFFYLKRILPRFDLMHMHVWNPGSGRYGFLAATKTPLVITEHDPFKLTDIKGWLKNKLIKKAKTIITVSKAASELVLSQDHSVANRLVVIPNGIDIEEWREESKLSDRNEFRSVHFRASPRDKVIICVGELHDRKGQKYLIEAYKKLVAEFPETKLVFVGDGPRKRYYEKLSRALSKNILFLGHKRNIAETMAASDIFVLPSIREAFGLVILEASISGVPIIATRVGGIPEIIEDGKTGLLVTPGNADELAESIKKLLMDPVLAANLKKEAASRTEMAFNAHEMAKRTEEVYDKMLEK